MQYPQDISSDTVAEMEATVDEYPYFQLLHTLIAKAKHDQQTPDAYASLGKAAVYAPDRRLLRQVFYDELALTLPSNEANILVDKPLVIIIEEDHHPAETTETNLTDVDTEEDNTVAAPDDTESLREESASSWQGLPESQQLPDRVEDTDALSPSENIDDSAEDSPILKQLEQTSEALSLRNKHQAEQQNIINKFVKANPSISRDTPSDEKESTDLAARSSKLQDNLVTENLAEIMLRQGKVDKATDLYQKLMLKYPEKKAYFAQKIEQLKNN